MTGYPPNNTTHRMKRQTSHDLHRRFTNAPDTGQPTNEANVRHPQNHRNEIQSIVPRASVAIRVPLLLRRQSCNGLPLARQTDAPTERGWVGGAGLCQSPPPPPPPVEHSSKKIMKIITYMCPRVSSANILLAFICLKIVDFPDSPAPNSKSLIFSCSF